MRQGRVRSHPLKLGKGSLNGSAVQLIPNCDRRGEMAEAVEEANRGVARTLKDLFAGAVGGVAQVLIGMIIVSLTIGVDSY